MPQDDRHGSRGKASQGTAGGKDLLLFDGMHVMFWRMTHTKVLYNRVSLPSLLHAVRSFRSLVLRPSKQGTLVPAGGAEWRSGGPGRLAAHQIRGCAPLQVNIRTVVRAGKLRQVRAGHMGLP